MLRKLGLNRTALAASSLLLFAASSCGGGGNTDWEELLADVTDEDLAVMVIPIDQLGDDVEGLEIDPGAGVQTSAEAAEDTLDADDTASDVEDQGFVSEYELFAFDQEFAALEAEGGIIAEGTVVSLFEDQESAAAAIEKEADDIGRFTGQEVEPGTVLAMVESWTVEGLEEGNGYFMRLDLDGTNPLYITIVGFRVDRLSGGVGIYRGDDLDLRERAEELARDLRDRAEATLRGEINETPYPIPGN